MYQDYLLFQVVMGKVCKLKYAYEINKLILNLKNTIQKELSTDHSISTKVHVTVCVQCVN